MNHNPKKSKSETERDAAKRRKNMSEIARVNAVARALGMSYGKYVCMARKGKK